jgi:hypothetical protein
MLGLNQRRQITWAWMLEYNEERDHDGFSNRRFWGTRLCAVSTYGTDLGLV